MNSKIKKYRQYLAEQGHELTLDQTKEFYINCKKLIKGSKKFSQFDLWNLLKQEEIDGFSKKDIEELVRFYKEVKDLML